jgi:hypothetical protein
MSEISACLVGRQRWTNLAVIEDLDILFGRDSAQATGMIQAWRRDACRRFILAFEQMKRMEIAAFGSNSFFYRKEKGLPMTAATLVGDEEEIHTEDDAMSMVAGEELLELRD